MGRRDDQRPAGGPSPPRDGDASVGIHPAARQASAENGGRVIRVSFEARTRRHQFVEGPPAVAHLTQPETRDGGGGAAAQTRPFRYVAVDVDFERGRPLDSERPVLEGARDPVLRDGPFALEARDELTAAVV